MNGNERKWAWHARDAVFAFIRVHSRLSSVPRSSRRSKRESTCRAGTFVVAFIAAVLFHANCRAADRPPNVVMIVADDQGWTDFGFMGHKVVRTPRLDALAAESAV